MSAQPDLSARTCMVTGASRGIGKATAAALAGMGAHVVLVCRDRERGEAAQGEIRARSGSETVELMTADLSSQRQIRQLAADFRSKHDRLHVLVNNAGAYNTERLLSEDGHELTFAVNHLAHFLLTNLLLDLLKTSAPSRIVNVSSRSHMGATIDFDDPHRESGYRGISAYGQSKLANVLFTRELAHRLEGTGVTAHSLHPGLVRTGFGRNNGGAIGALFRVFQTRVFQIVPIPFILTPEQGAETSIYLASSPDVESVTGKYFVKKEPVPSSESSSDPALAARLWQVSEELAR